MGRCPARETALCELVSPDSLRGATRGFQVSGKFFPIVHTELYLFNRLSRRCLFFCDNLIGAGGSGEMHSAAWIGGPRSQFKVAVEEEQDPAVSNAVLANPNEH